MNIKKLRLIIPFLVVGLVINPFSVHALPDYSREEPSSWRCFYSSFGATFGLAFGGFAGTIVGAYIVGRLLSGELSNDAKPDDGDEVNQKPVSMDDVVGQDEVMVEVKEYIDFLKNPERYTRVGARRPRGLILHGPPGCGKTLIARAISGESQCYFKSISGSEFVNKYVGTGPAAVRRLFNDARQQAKTKPVVLFIDEIDGIGKRSDSDSGGTREYNNTINEFLKQMDGFTQDDNILVIGATNYLDKLDPALLRPGRFDRKVKVDLPTKAGREALLLYFLNKDKPLAQGLTPVSLAKEFAGRTPGFSGAAIENFVNEAATLAGRDNATSIAKKHFEEAFDKVTLGLKSSAKPSEKSLRRTAYHEAGHALIAVLFGLPVTKVSILPRGNALGVTHYGEVEDSESDYTKSDLLHLLMKSQGGLVAEKLIFGEATPGAQQDLKVGAKIARLMIHQWGMGNGLLYGVIGDAVSSSEWQKRFDDQVVELIERSMNETTRLLKRHKSHLTALAESLLKHETLGSSAIESILGAAKGAQQGVTLIRD